MNTIKNDRLWIKAYDWIKKEIFNGSLKEGMPLSESMLAQEVKISRTPIREALSVLERHGYVTLVSGKGAFVSSISMDVVREIYEIRRLLEPYAARTAIYHIPDDLLDSAEKNWLRIQSLIENGIEVNWPGVASLDKDLHVMVTMHTANRHIRDILLPYNAQMERFQLLSAKALANVEETTRQHLSIIACIKKKDENELAELLLEHIISSENNIRKLYSPYLS
ncbi:GntR family transcriptional regulator [Synergistales bacterium]|nr:GntR family transcriptional regulator [Synergistales bacterium]